QKRGYFVPNSGSIHGGHHPLVRQLCGQAVPPHQRDAAVRLASAVKDTKCEAVVISSEALDGLLVNRECARQFFSRMEALNLQPRLVFFPRNQSQLVNSRYTEGSSPSTEANHSRPSFRQKFGTQVSDTLT